MKALGIVLIVLGVLALAYGGFTYTHQKKVVDLGPIQASKKRNKYGAITSDTGRGCRCRWRSSSCDGKEIA